MVLGSIAGGPVVMILVIVFAVPLLALAWEAAWSRWMNSAD